MKRKTGRRWLLMLLGAGCMIPAYAQFEKDIYTCDEETYRLLKDLSDSQLGNGSIYLFTTTHQDLAWLNHLDACIADRDTLWLTPFLKRLEEDPAFKMDIEQTSIVMEYLHRHPETKPLFDKYIKDGRICIGGTFVQPYEEMYSGESLARQFYLGARWLKQTFDGYQTLSYFNVDVPGRTLQMPQIMKKAGVNNLVISRHERGLFNWAAPDGSMVRTYTPGHYIYFYNVMAKPDTAAVKELGKEAILWYTKYNNHKNAETVMPAMLNYELSWDQKPVANSLKFTEKWNQIRYIRKAGDKKFTKVNLPKFRYATADNFFNALDRSTGSLPVSQGERPNVWLYIHGPSHEKAVTASRKGDMLLPAAERLASCRAMCSGSFVQYPEQALHEAWKAKIYPDHGWGGNRGELTDNEFRRQYEFALSEAEKLLSQEAAYLASSVRTDLKKGRPVVLFNHLAYRRTVPVSYVAAFGEGEAMHLTLSDAEGKKLPVQLSEIDRYADGSIKKVRIDFVASDVPSLGHQTYYVNPCNAAPSSAEVHADSVRIDNPFYTISLVPGGIRSLYDKALGKELLRTDKFLGGEIVTLHSEGNGAGEFDAVQQPDMEGFDKVSLHAGQWQLIENGPVFSSYKLRSPIRHAVVEQTLKIYHQTKRIDIHVDLLNWEGVMFREFRMMWPLAMEGASVSYEAPYGSLTVGRDEMPGAAGERYYELNKNQHPRGIGNWICAGDKTGNVILTGSVAVADYIDPTDNPVPYPILQPVLMASRKSCHYLGNDYFQPGDHSFDFSITSQPVSASVEEAGVSPNAPLLVTDSPVAYAKAALPENYSFLSLDNPNVKVTALKKCEDDNSWIVRMYNCSGEPQKVNLALPFTPLAIKHTTLIEEELETVNALVLEPFAIETYKIIR